MQIVHLIAPYLHSIHSIARSGGEENSLNGGTIVEDAQTIGLSNCLLYFLGVAFSRTSPALGSIGRGQVCLTTTNIGTYISIRMLGSFKGLFSHCISTGSACLCFECFFSVFHRRAQPCGAEHGQVVEVVADGDGLGERDAVIVTQISQRRKGDAVPTALDSPDIQISIKTHVFLRQATLPANGFQSLYNLLHQQVIAPLSFHIANYCNNEIKFYYTLVSGGGISDISDAILHCLFPINTKISHLYPHGEPQIHGKTGSTSAQFVP